MRWGWLAGWLGVVSVVCAADAPKPTVAGRDGQIVDKTSKSRPEEVVQVLVKARETLAEVPFADLVRATTGKRILPIEPARDATLLARIGGALDRVLRVVGAKVHAAHAERRINEVSRHFEMEIRSALNETAGFSCDYPKNADGRAQRAGYPDLRLVDDRSGRVVYLDPKLFAAKSRGSSFRTFYFTPQTGTGKIHEDAHHLLIGIPHAGKVDGAWQFGDWELVDLAKFRVRLKVEFQAGNRDIYRGENIVARGGRR